MPEVYVINRWVDDDGPHEVGEALTFPETPEDPAEHTIEHHKLGYLLHNGMVSPDRAEAEKAKQALAEGAPAEPTSTHKTAGSKARAAKKQ